MFAMRLWRIWWQQPPSTPINYPHDNIEQVDNGAIISPGAGEHIVRKVSSEIAEYETKKKLRLLSKIKNISVITITKHKHMGMISKPRANLQF